MPNSDQQDAPHNSKVLVLFAHPSIGRSEVNKPLFELSQTIPGVTAVDLYAEYPTFRINIDKEQQRLKDHDVVVFMFPLYWYSTPAIFKEWQDLVLEYGFAYGHDGTALHGKSFMCVISAGGKEEAYQTDGYNHFSIRELLQPLEQTANLTGMRYLAPFVLFGSRTAVEEGRVKAHAKQWKQTLQALVADKVDLKKARQVPLFNQHLGSVIKEPQL
jgi:putative NADPH-quinone reductase